MTLYTIVFIGLLVWLAKNINDLLAPYVRHESKPDISTPLEEDRSGLSLSLLSCGKDHFRGVKW